MDQSLHLLLDCDDYLGMTVAETVDRDTADKIKIFLPVRKDFHRTMIYKDSQFEHLPIFHYIIGCLRTT